MMIARLAAFGAIAIVTTANVAAAELPIAGLAIGESVANVALRLGPPGDVASLDTGNRFTFGPTTVYVDGDGTVLAVETRSGSPRVAIDGRPVSLPVGSYSIGRADAELSAVAEFSWAAMRSYRLADRRALVLAFSATNGRLERVAYGEPGQLARLGLLPGDAAAKAVPYHAPVPRGSLPAPRLAGTPTVYRLEVDRSGAVTGAGVLIADSAPANDPDPAVERRLRALRYRPATLGGRPIGATVFIAVPHV